MNLIIGAPIWLTILLLISLAAAALEDAIRLRISNVTCAAVFVGALVAMVLNGFSVSLWQNALICLAILVIGTPAFARGWFGGGDIKLLASVGLWLDLKAASGLLAAVFIAGGLLGVVYLTARRITRPNPQSPSQYTKVPYGLAIVFGALFIFGTQLSQQRSNPFLEHMKALEAQEHAQR